ncbi:MAG: hypothetical protein LBI79_10545 [Nitrososphaerota archaeon]|jgi:hypothetical protein|nr:hypothetical protein [Nitrososphaerota archaeon]
MTTQVTQISQSVLLDRLKRQLDITVEHAEQLSNLINSIDPTYLTWQATTQQIEVAASLKPGYAKPSSTPDVFTAEKPALNDTNNSVIDVNSLPWQPSKTSKGEACEQITATSLNEATRLLLQSYVGEFRLGFCWWTIPFKSTEPTLYCRKPIKKTNYKVGIA